MRRWWAYAREAIPALWQHLRDDRSAEEWVAWTREARARYGLT